MEWAGSDPEVLRSHHRYEGFRKNIVDGRIFIFKLVGEMIRSVGLIQEG